MEHRAPVVWKDDEGRTRTGEFIGIYPEGILVQPVDGRFCYVDEVEPMGFLRKHRKTMLIALAIIAYFALMVLIGFTADGGGDTYCDLHWCR